MDFLLRLGQGKNVERVETTWRQIATGNGKDVIMDNVTHLATETIESGIDRIRASPKLQGVLDMIVVRPTENERSVLETAEISATGGVPGDNWARGCWKSLPDGSPDPDVQIAIMNSRTIALLAPDKARWPLAGDQLFIDLDLSNDNLRPGDTLAIGTAVLRVTDVAHNGCQKFRQRFGLDALKFVNSEVGKHLHLRGIYARIVQDGRISAGNTVTKTRSG